MNLAQELLNIEKHKEAILEKSVSEGINYYFCFITTTPIQFGIPNKSGDPKKMGFRIFFEFVDFNIDEKSHFNSSMLTTTIRQDTDKKIIFENSGSYEDRQLKTINPKGMFFINNYNDLTDKQKKESVKQINAYYEKAQDPYDSWAIPSLSVKNIVGYVKKSKIEFTLEDFVKDITNQVKDIVAQHLSEVLVQQTYVNWHAGNIDKIYKLTQKDKNSLIKYINNNLNTITTPKKSKKSGKV